MGERNGGKGNNVERRAELQMHGDGEPSCSLESHSKEDG